MKYFLLTLWITLIIFGGISGGGDIALGIFLLPCFIAGVWTVISVGVDGLLGSQEPRSAPPMIYPTRYMPWDEREHTGDPTRPDDEHPVIVLKDYEWRRVK